MPDQPSLSEKVLSQKVLVTGATGFVGTHFRKRLADGHHQLVTLARDGLDGEQLAVDRDSSVEDWTQALSAVDRVVHLAGIAHRQASVAELEATNVLWPEKIYQACGAAGVESFLWLSSIKVLGDVSEAPLAIDAPYKPVDDYARSKEQGERALLKRAAIQATELQIVRPPLVYGPMVTANFFALLQVAAWSRRGLPLPLASARAPRSFVGIDNLCDLLIHLAGQRGGIYHVADARDLSLVELLKLLGARSGILWPLSPRLLEWIAGSTGQEAIYQKLFKPLQVDQSATLDRTGWQPPSAIEEQLGETVAWFRASR
jgi:nucleoside-diphosphate-sugar epimerase